MIKRKLSVNVLESDRDAASHLFKALGMDMTTAINLFLKQSIAENGLPFRPQLVNDTAKAVYAARTGQVQHFDHEADWQASVLNELKNND
ncbi:type II toxin-antitoxin system RelB/DinJ family antitoxin [Lactiplantibacillus garii]|uniref:Type II toxin-antitoxin system RelB/DinJ family antitoxin n=2 Tax=Lactiplantibacillus garii TaxID=2306423 RepID=A0A3R8KLH6_9LACO|nr:type II toxin-antitoxin system RelB/DinJ family antitoxin [Lactiplantibacillus garii]